MAAAQTRRSALESLTRFLPLAVQRDAPPAPTTLRTYLALALDPEGHPDGRDDCGRWLDCYSLKLRDLSKEVLAAVDLQLDIGDNGEPLAAHTTSRRRSVARSCIRRAVQLDLLAADPWPTAPKGRAARKLHRRRRAVDVQALPDPPTMARVLAAIATHQPGSRTYQQMTAVIYYAGLRPSEVLMLRRRNVTLPSDDSWGRIDVVEADIDHDVPGEPKTGPRSVPIPPVLVAQLRAWVATHARHSDDLRFRTRTDGRPSSSNWSRAWHRALESVGAPPLRIYDCRHAAATTWLASGAPLGEVAVRSPKPVSTRAGQLQNCLAGLGVRL